MEFAFTEEQQMIRDTAAAFLADVSSSEAVRTAMATEQGYDESVWQRICSEMYLQATHIPEAYGGMGLGYVELVAVLEQMGRYLLCSPFYSTVCLAANSLLVAGSEAQKEQYLTQIAAGSLTGTLAYTDTNGRWDADAVQATWAKDGDDYVLNGTLRYVPDGHTAGLLVVAARSEGSTGEDGIGLFLIEADHAGMAREWLPTMDQTRKQGQIELTDVRLPASAVMGEAGSAGANLATIIQLGQISIAADQAGGAARVLDYTVEYTNERYQFNRPVSSFQSMKHKAADMMLKAEVSRSSVYYAACVAQEALFGDAESYDLAEAASMAKIYCSESYFFNAGSAIQMFGGVGFTWEYDVHLFFKRAKSTETFLGASAYHRELIAKQLLD